MAVCEVVGDALQCDGEAVSRLSCGYGVLFAVSNVKLGR